MKALLTLAVAGMALGCESRRGSDADVVPTIVEFPVTSFDGAKRLAPMGITVGPDGNLWFAVPDANRIDSMTPDGKVTEYLLPTPGSRPWAITLGSDGNLWFSEGEGRRIGRLTPTGEIHEFPLPTATAIPDQIITGPDGNMWFVEQRVAIGRITPDGTITEFPAPAFGGIAVGPDGTI